nr:hypothetical protein [Corynebacterium aquatimens]
MACLAIVVASPHGSVASAGGPPIGTSAAAPEGTRYMHRDLSSTDAVPWAGPNAAGRVASSIPGGTCSTVFQASDGMVLGLCTRYVGTNQGPNGSFGLNLVVPSVMLFDPKTAQPLATLELKKTSLLGGVYGFMDEHDRVVMPEGRDIVHIGHRFDGKRWVLSVDKRTALNLPAGTSLGGLSPDGQGRTWFVTQDSQVGLVDGRKVIKQPLAGVPGREHIANGLTGRPHGVSVLTTHALYEVVYRGGKIVVEWRKPYDRGSGRKPGQLSWGSGTTPTFFGPNSKWVAIVDNADNSPNLMVMDAKTGKDVCRMPAFERVGKGTENSLLAHGNTLWIPSTYGFSYPPFAVDGPQKPMFAQFNGGLSKVDVVERGGSVSCERRWENHTRIETLPTLTLKDRRIWALSTRPGSLSVDLIGVDADSGREVARRPLGTLPFDRPMQLTGMITPDGAYWQGTLSRMIKLK